LFGLKLLRREEWTAPVVPIKPIATGQDAGPVEPPATAEAAGQVEATVTEVLVPQGAESGQILAQHL
jgi:hypothetical protein